MLPTKGFFKDIECPYNETSCWRPYCHFMHKKKPLETEANSEGETDAIPTYKPTPKSELEIIHNSHIPIQYVPDLVYQRPKIGGGSSKCDKPTYNPTPLSILSSAKNKRLSSVEGNSENLQTIKEIKQTIADTEYVPTSVSGAVQPSLDIDFENLEQEFELIDDIINNSTDNKNKNNKIIEDKKTEDVAVKEKKSEKRDKHKHRSKSSKSSDKSKEKRVKSAKEEHKKDDRDKHRKEEHKDRKKHHSKDKKRDKSKKRSRSRSRDNKKKTEKKTKLIENDTDTSVGSKIEFDIDSDLDDEQDTMMECFKIFKEYQPEDKKTKPREPEPERQEEISITPIVEPKKRIAHTNAIEKPITKQKQVPLPGQVMANRYKTALANQTEKEPEMLFKEIKQMKKPPPVSLLEAAKARKVQKELEKAKNPNVVDSILKGSNQQPVVATLHKPIKKIAPVQNVSLLTKAKERISKIKTVAHTQKGTRVAHIPGNVIEDIPDVIQADKSKLPVNVRTKFLTMIIDECKKLYLSKDEAYTRALNEEFSCYEKCKVLATYRNSAMLSINRLRKEIQERQASGLGLIEDANEGLTHSNLAKKEQFYQKVKKWVLTEDDLNLHGYPRECPTKPGRAVIMNSNNKKNDGLNLSKNERCCARCKKIYRVNDVGWPLFDEECMYHPLRKRTLRGEQIYLCCKSNDDTGCWTSDTHVSENLDLDGFQTTMIPDSENDPRSYAVYALDCEMCYTTKGLELTRVTIVDTDCKTVYETLVKPMNPIIDYNTRFSGITKNQMDKTSTNILQVQANILHLCNSKTILVGHSLESDMKALKIVHSTVIDTSVLFPHKMGLPHKRALKSLATDYLRKIIQNDVNGHDSAEDAITCMELLNWKLKEELKCGVK